MYNVIGMLRNQRGQALVDYALIVVMAVVLVAVMVATMGNQVLSVLRSTANTLQV